VEVTLAHRTLDLREWLLVGQPSEGRKRGPVGKGGDAKKGKVASFMTASLGRLRQMMGTLLSDADVRGKPSARMARGKKDAG